MNRSPSLYVGLLTQTSPLVLNPRDVEHFIFCGVKAGSATLNLQVLDEAQNIIAQASAYLHLKDIKEMYERWTVGDDGTKEPESTAYLAPDSTPSPTPFEYGPPETSDTPYILHVHGWNTEPWEKDRFAESMFKRLYWQGYAGSFGMFRWPTRTGLPTTFNPSEFNAWKSGSSLNHLLMNLNSIYPGRVYLTAHSMGNIVAGQALRLAGNNKLVHTFVAMQAAIASHAYDPTAPPRSLGILDSFTYDRHSEYWASGSPSYFANAGGAVRYINFYNKDDWALSWWESGQDIKPSTGYTWVSVPNESERYYYTDWLGRIRPLRFPQDTFEIFSFETEGRCFALGAQVGVGGVFGTGDQVDLRAAPFQFGDLHKGHSAQFRSTNMRRHVFWEKLLQKMQLK